MLVWPSFVWPSVYYVTWEYLTPVTRKIQEVKMRKMKENSGPTTAGRNKDKTTLARPNPSSTESLPEECSEYIKMGLDPVSPDRAGDVNLLAEDLLG